MKTTENQIKKGQTLTGLSSAIIVYILAGGRITETGSLYGGTPAHFENPIVIELSFIVLLFYVAYRYYLSRPNVFKDFTYSTRVNVKKDKRFSKFIKRRLNRYLIEEYLEKNVNNPPNNIRWYRSNVPVNQDSRGFKVTAEVQRGRTNIGNKDVEISTKNFWWYSLHTIFKTEDFWVILFPWLMFSTSLVFIAIKMNQNGIFS